MAPIASSSPRNRKKATRKRVIAALTAVLATTAIKKSRKPPQPKHTSVLTGRLWLAELLSGHPERFQEQLGVSRHVFRKMSRQLQQDHGLRDRRGICADEQLAIFLYFARHGSSSRMLQERFQRSGDTVSKAIHALTKMFVGSFYRKYVHPLPDETPFAILNNPCLYPYFGNCRGAIDGSTFDSRVEQEALARYRTRKGRISQNVLAGADWELKFIYLLTGWEGSAADSRVFDYARMRDLQLPAGRYFLADAGFPLCDMLMTPYRGVRYHLQEWRRGNQRPQNHEELFNLRHAQARNVVERIFGIFKRRFGLTTRVPEYSTAMQSRFICAMAAIHNFIRHHDPADRFIQEAEADFRRRQATQASTDTAETPRAAQPEPVCASITPAERRRAKSRRETIAKQMWEDYQIELSRRGLL